MFVYLACGGECGVEHGGEADNVPKHSAQFYLLMLGVQESEIITINIIISKHVIEVLKINFPSLCFTHSWGNVTSRMSTLSDAHVWLS